MIVYTSPMETFCISLYTVHAMNCLGCFTAGKAVASIFNSSQILTTVPETPELVQKTHPLNSFPLEPLLIYITSCFPEK